MMMTKLEDFGELWPAEAKLVANVSSGKIIEIAKERPGRNAPREYRVRATLVGFLAQGGCDACRPSRKGVWIMHAYIEGDNEHSETAGVDLTGCGISGDLALIGCYVPDTVFLLRATGRSLYFNGSHFPDGFIADGLTLSHDLHFRNFRSEDQIRLVAANIGGQIGMSGCRLIGAPDAEAVLYADNLLVEHSFIIRSNALVYGTVRLLRVKITGDLDCEGSEFRTSKGCEDTFLADGISVGGSVFLRRGARFVGPVRLPNAQIDGVLDCSAAEFILDRDGYAALDLSGAVIQRDVLLTDQAQFTGPVRCIDIDIGCDCVCDGASFAAASGPALDFSRARIRKTLFLQSGAVIVGGFALTETEIGALCDDPACWPEGEDAFDLSGCVYQQLTGRGVNARERLDLLSRFSRSGYIEGFQPQPYEQLAKVFRDMGHRVDAKAVLYEKERLQRRARRDGYVKESDPPGLLALGLGDGFLRWVIGYGQYPLRAVVWLAIAWVIGVAVFQNAAEQHAIKPNSAFVLRSTEWADCAPSQPLNPESRSQLACFQDQSQAASYPKFNPWIYSADTLLPIVDLEMQTHWIPDERSPVGDRARLFLWAQIIAGWALSLIAVAGFSGLIKSE